MSWLSFDDHLSVNQHSAINNQQFQLLPYTLSILAPTRHNNSYGIVPIDAAISRTSSDSFPCSPMMTTSSPGATSVPVTSIMVMSMQTDPMIGARRPRTSM